MKGDIFQWKIVLVLLVYDRFLQFTVFFFFTFFFFDFYFVLSMIF